MRRPGPSLALAACVVFQALGVPAFAGIHLDPEPVPVDDEYRSNDVSVALTEDGRFLVVWSRRDESLAGAWCSIEDRSCGAEFVLGIARRGNGAPSGGAIHPVGDGRMLVSWYAKGPERILGRFLAPGETRYVPPSTLLTGFDRRERVAFAGSGTGRLVMVWTAEEPDPFQVVDVAGEEVVAKRDVLWIRELEGKDGVPVELGRRRSSPAVHMDVDARGRTVFGGGGYLFGRKSPAGPPLFIEDHPHGVHDVEFLPSGRFLVLSSRKSRLAAATYDLWGYLASGPFDVGTSERGIAGTTTSSAGLTLVALPAKIYTADPAPAELLLLGPDGELIDRLVLDLGESVRRIWGLHLNGRGDFALVYEKRGERSGDSLRARRHISVMLGSVTDGGSAPR